MNWMHKILENISSFSFLTCAIRVQVNTIPKFYIVEKNEANEN